MGKRFFLDYPMFDSILDIDCFGLSISSKIPWPSNFEVIFEQGKRYISFDNRPSSVGPKNLSFENRVIAHIVVATLIPCVGLFSTLS